MADEPEIWVDPLQRAGEWADFIRVFDRPDSFVIDFAGRDPSKPDQATLVARIVVSPGTANDLQRELENAWRRYTRYRSHGESDETD